MLNSSVNNCLQQSAIYSNVNKDTEMIPAAREVRTLNYNSIVLIIFCEITARKAIQPL